MLFFILLLFFHGRLTFIKIPKSLANTLTKYKKIPNRTHGTTVIRIQVHVESAAIVALRAAMVTEFSTDLNALKTVMNFFGGIFDMVNEDIGNLGVQVRGDFSKLLIDNMPWDKTSCKEGDPLRVRTNIAQTVFSLQGASSGFKMMLLFCPELMLSPPRAVEQTMGCNTLTGIMFGELSALKDVVLDSVYKIISGGHSKPLGSASSFERGVSKNTSDCIGHTKSENGEFVRDLKAVRHLATERYILEEGKKVKEHDLMDDIYLLKAGKKQIVGYPTEDYSNDDELYTDINDKE
ncbi:hypothetical protein M153_8665000909 [Pseudoloma neurophilia]|uniref:Uncharacterized protein n=1 Tax=Pseudoloma neurophilia TaxID=146866 RepID=A0A0R0LRZ5_9MICR|nr:hypothetical protein M153_8665000909 [Pseudoloma neurophilia]